LRDQRAVKCYVGVYQRAGVTRAHCASANTARARDARYILRVPGECASFSLLLPHTCRQLRVARRAPCEQQSLCLRGCDVTRLRCHVTVTSHTVRDASSLLIDHICITPLPNEAYTSWCARERYANVCVCSRSVYVYVFVCGYF